MTKYLHSFKIFSNSNCSISKPCDFPKYSFMYSLNQQTTDGYFEVNSYVIKNVVHLKGNVLIHMWLKMLYNNVNFLVHMTWKDKFYIRHGAIQYFYSLL